MTFDDINEFAGGTLDPDTFRPICTVEDCTHYLYDDPEAALPEGTDTVYVEEFGKLKDAADELLTNSEFGKPKDPMDSIVGSKIEFETTDTDGNPVPGVTVQFCSDAACMMGETDETGTAVFQEEEGHYTVHILKAPEEYVVDEAEYTLEAFCDLTIFLYKA